MRVRARGVTVRFPGRTVLDGVDLDVAVGEVVALMGPSGSGKSTLLGVLGGLVRPTSGACEVLGAVEDATGSSDLRWVFQTVNVVGRRSARENVAMGRMQTGVRRSQALAEASSILSRVNLIDQQDHRCCTLSGGELQRVVVARALVGEPALVLADEPTGQLDRASATLIAGMLTSAKHPTTSVVVATHDPEVAAACDRTLHLRDGKLCHQ